MPAVGKRLKIIKRGEKITADFLNESVDQVNELTDLLVKPPEQITPANDPELQIEDPEADDIDTYIEQSRTVTEVQVDDQNEENYATIDRITTIELLNGNGESLKMRINN